MLIDAPVASAGRRAAAKRTRHRGPDDAAIAACFAGLEQVDAILLAVSGGPDSMALLLMAARWARARDDDGPAIHIATVDHGLRAEARSEAQAVAVLAHDHGFSHVILPWTGLKPSSRVQERARAARYGLLAAHARAIGATHVLTAHHADDQAETVLLRLGRGSGLAGLAGMSRLSALAPNVCLVRPLLGLTKEDLVAICRAEGCGFVDDPSNRDLAYARARLRAQAPALAALGLDTGGLLRLAGRMARAEAALEVETDRVEALLAPCIAGRGVTVDLAPVLAHDLPREIGIRLVRRAIERVVGPYRIRLDRLESLVEALWAARAEGHPHRATLAGTRIVLTRRALLEIRAETPRSRGRRPLPES